MKGRRSLDAYLRRMRRENPLISPRDRKGRIKRLKSIVWEVFQHVFRLSDGNYVKAAKALGIGRSTIYRKFR